MFGPLKRDISNSLMTAVTETTVGEGYARDMKPLCRLAAKKPKALTPDQRLVFFLMSAPRSVSQAVLSHLPTTRVGPVAASRNNLPGLTNDDRRAIQSSAARVLGITSDGLTVLFYKRPRWAVSMLEYWAARGSYLEGLAS